MKDFSFAGFFGACGVFVVVFAMLIISYTPIAPIASGGIDAAETDAAHYFEITSSPVLDDTAITLDWNNMQAAVGQELYNDGQSVITIAAVSEGENGNYNLHLEAVGHIAASGGRVVTVLSHDGNLPEGYILATVGDTSYASKTITERGQSVLKAGDTAVIPVFDGEVPAEEIAANGNQVTIELERLQKICFERV